MDRSTLVASDAAKMDWVPWAMRGADFKLLHADGATGKYTLLIRFGRDVVAPLHRHVGAVEGYVLEGSFHYHDEPDVTFGPGCYLFEHEGAIHQPVSPDGAVMFAVFHGPVEGLDADGNVTGRIDWKWHVDAWSASSGPSRYLAG